ncbi:uncharacterized protein B0H18DRAFT_1036207 [Fomitopsis serialis]|uniref:uncharacterized protein n=1 Tax=Fomitopsis serialis TaxID=139415 RepID=UPI0020081E61|nr:uncharacterized protein B0H18DRAFT_1036207 [Neoantrodia serialis]KAH9917016.1 hypothetical protein B0H18DRAFT_1036207 [Neoantrodia serialis]
MYSTFTMADGSLHSLTSTLATQQSLAAPEPSQQPAGTAPVAPPPPQLNGAPLVLGPDTIIPEVPVKRKPGRPKGSGKKQLDPNAEPKPKRPVGRPRKDGLPAGSVGPKRPGRPRKRPPGSFASGGQSTAWRASVPPMGSLPAGPPPPPPPPAAQLAFHIDPNLDRDNWTELSRTRPDVFLSALVAALSAPNPVSHAGPSVEDAFRSHLASLAPASKNTPSIPTLYSVLKTFWLPSSPVYFSLTASASTARTPSDHRFLYWDPQPLVFNGIACPACSTPLINRGRISSGPMKVHDLGKPFFIIGCEYVCNGQTCVQQTSPDGRKFASTDASILRSLPSKLQDEFPAYLLQGAPDLGTGPEIWNWQGMGVSIALWNMVHACLRAGLRKEPIVDIIHAVQDPVKDENVRQMQMQLQMQMPPPAPPPQASISAPPVLEQPDEPEEEEENEDATRVEGDLEYPKDVSMHTWCTLLTDHSSQPQPAEEYNEAWNANNGTAEAEAAQPQAGPSNAPDTNGQPAAAPSISQGPPAPTNGAAPPPPPPAPATSYGPYPYPPYPYFQPPPPPPDPNAANPNPNPNPNLLKRTFRSWMARRTRKRIRHCCKCGSNECKGKGGRAFCTNPCQDCGSSRRPDRTCSDAWP